MDAAVGTSTHRVPPVVFAVVGIAVEGKISVEQTKKGGSPVTRGVRIAREPPSSRGVAFRMLVPLGVLVVFSSAIDANVVAVLSSTYHLERRARLVKPSILPQCREYLTEEVWRDLLKLLLNLFHM
jgi:hypothetical protein